MFHEIAFSGVLLPPIFVSIFLCLPFLYVFKMTLARWHWLQQQWHPALIEFALSLIFISAWVLYV
ncbi:MULTISPECIES: DUF1656 domain-containing protein [Providencia]|uniref:DUF1656 domain-containing protein n=1 Tax=Providencia heimbachae ATCC 35613 TaxID=1354272 RepID=A0A1B7JLB3_9GAMM|nr:MULTISPECIES: DUF1656 domain-containing protein [Providencia]MBP6123966.1 DUF1656 domain-containing protein [Providencia sp.]NIH21902.1 DUF1656 domain-containing protein [Providencia heimbachae]OAT48733.1 hypothetical protein M998_3234 [Providencia heimbachae ATCC 35613]SQH12454.1 Protein of uncharacterised function (DUF1656) [Providencia heimbachae]